MRCLPFSSVLFQLSMFDVDFDFAKRMPFSIILLVGCCFTRDVSLLSLSFSANQRRIPRVPVRYPLTLTLQHTTELKNSSRLKRSNPLLTTRHRQKNRRLLTHQMNRQRRKPLTLLLLVALSPPVNQTGR